MTQRRYMILRRKVTSVPYVPCLEPGRTWMHGIMKTKRRFNERSAVGLATALSETTTQMVRCGRRRGKEGPASCVLYGMSRRQYEIDALVLLFVS